MDGITKIPVLSEDIYDLYKYWCGRQGVKPSPMNRAVDHIANRPGVIKCRKRFLKGAKQTNPKMFIYPPGGEEMKPGNSESAWLGQCVEEFRLAMNEYKGGSYDG